ncbi:hypothetical protein GGR56DRAFT_272631 [Xylariaceae sp. FL0804]|nr:hypothetical protein GGR56DRAFT_272631 [Xylariaceae sp. FL0804]
MAPPNEDPLQTLDRVFGEVLVQTGKQLKASAKLGHRSAAGPGTAVRAKIEDTLSTYHHALDDMESEILRAKAVLLRDLEKLRAARAPPPAPAPAPVRAPAPVPEPVAPPAPMMEMPSTAAHSVAGPGFPPARESKTVAPFPDMGMGMGMSSSDVVDLTGGDRKPSPRVTTTAIKPPHPPQQQQRTAPAAVPVKPEAKPSPKPPPKAAPPPKVTPVPPPQIPRLQPPTAAQPKPQAAATRPQPPAQPAPSAPSAPSQKVPSAAAAVPPVADVGLGGGGTLGSAGGELNFTDMGFALDDSQGAPPAPMAEMDLDPFPPSMANNGTVTSMGQQHGGSAAPLGTSKAAAAAPAAQQPPVATGQPAAPNADDSFNLGDPNGSFDLDQGFSNESTFDDMLFFNDNSEMAQFDDAFFGMD